MLLAFPNFHQSQLHISQLRDLALTQSGDFAIDAPFYQAISLRAKCQISHPCMRDFSLTQSGDFATDAFFYQAISLRAKSRIRACEIWP
jgi:hypothetical protein